MRKAFTLIELLVVLAIAAIAIAILIGVFTVGSRDSNPIPPPPPIVPMEKFTEDRPADIIPVTLRGNKYIVIYKDPDHVTIHRQKECENEGASGTDRTSDPKQLP